MTTTTTGISYSHTVGFTFVASRGDLRFEPESEAACAKERVVELLQLMLSTREYRMA